MGPGSPLDGSEQFRSAFNDASLGMAVVGSDGALERVNPGLCRMTGYAESQLLAGSGLSMLLPREDRESFSDEWQKACGGGAPLDERDRRVVCADGAVLWVHISLSVVVGRAG